MRVFWSDSDTKKLEELCKKSSSFKGLQKKALRAFPEKTWMQIRNKLSIRQDLTQHFKDKRVRHRTIEAKSSSRKRVKEVILEERSFSLPEVLKVSPAAYNRPGARIGLYSGCNYKEDGFRANLIRLARELSRQEGTHFDIWNGGLVKRKWINQEIKRRTANIHHDLHRSIIDHLLDEAAQELSSVIPKLKKPGKQKGSGSYIRLYIIISPNRDGVYGEEIARRLQGLRPEDIRCYRAGGDRIDVKQPGRGQNKVLWVINPHKPRLPSKYHSQVAEREIDDKRRQTTKQYPDLWIVGPFASNIHKPDGERKEPYVTMGVLRRLEEVEEAENQISFSVIEYTPKGRRFVRVWDLKDIVANELENITGIKAGAKDIHQRIVDVLKRHRPITLGLLADELGRKREFLEKEIAFLVEEEKSLRKTWPGLYYDKASQRYDFHLDWLQDRLPYPHINIHDEGLKEDRILFIGCPHAGLNSVDYRFIVKDLPQIITEQQIQTMPILGDIIAGIHHDYILTGEVFGSLNNTDQEEFAAELFGTVIIRVFTVRVAEKLASFQGSEISSSETEQLISESLLDLPYIPGNHDLWQERDGATPLEIFKNKLSGLLARHITKFLAGAGLPAVDVFSLVDGKITGMPDYKAVYRLPSGLSLEMYHPHMARAATTSLRAQKILDDSASQIVGIANFHTATVVHNWYSDRGQCVAVQTGTLATSTRFEERKIKQIDFGPVYLRVLSKNQRIVMTESAYFNEPRLQKTLSKSTNIEGLKRKLGLIRV